jgi:DNA-binding NarL/FixJ family response regulator
VSAAPVRLLIVDDHPVVREGLRARFGSAAHIEVVGEAGSAPEAMERVATCEPSLVLMDVGLKGTTGIELAAMLLERHALLKVLMFSVYDNPDYVQRALQAGACGYVLKDAPTSELLAAIDVVAQGGTYLGTGVSKRLFRGQAPRPMLSPRESEILSALGRGEPSKLIARELGLSVRTVEAHRQNIRRKLAIDGQAELIKYAVEHARRHGDD